MAGQAGIDAKAFEERLRGRRAEIVALEATAEALHTSVELDQTRIGRLSRMDAIQAHEMEEETERRRDAEIKRIDAALQRVADGEFGYCVACGQRIAAKRLDVEPSVPTCIDCANR